ncbi:MAG: porin [Chromatiales bacterium]|nr:porin [Chromatiales bacterium]
MNKKLIALAVTSALATPFAALADVSVSAGIQTEISDFDNNGSLDGVRTGDADESGGFSFIKFTGSEKLDNGWTAFGVINFSFDPTGNAGLGQRESYVGMKNDVFTFSTGTMNSSYKAVSVAYDPFLATSLQARGNGGMSGGAGLGNFGHSSYLEDVIHVIVKSGAITADVQYIADEIANQNGSGVEDGSYVAFLKYDAGSFEVFGATNHAETSGGDFDGYKVGGKFQTGDLTLAAQYESTELGVFYGDGSGITGGNSDDEAEILFGSATYKLGNITLAGWVANYEQDDLDGVSFSLGGFYNFSKRTRIHAGYRSTDLEGDNGVADVEEDVVALGIRFVL